jgi:hypothetical protein
VKKSLKKLMLHRETLRLLISEQARRAVGGDPASWLPPCPPPPLTTDSVQACCAEI